MAHETVVDAALAEIDRAIRTLRAAQRMLVTLQRAGDQGTPPKRSGLRGAADLRYSGMTVIETAAALGLGEEHVRRLLRRGDLAGVPYGGTIGWRLDRAYVTRLAEQIAAADEEKEAARLRLIPGLRPIGRPPKLRPRR